MPNRHIFDVECTCHLCGEVKSKAWITTAMIATMVLLPAIGYFLK